MNQKEKTHGFTLIELLVVVGIIGIISAIAFPAYQGYVSDSYKSQAVADLNVCALAMERYYSDKFTYTSALVDISADTICINRSPTSSTLANAKYIISVNIPTANTYTLTATPNGGACGGEACFTLAQDGTKGVD